MLFKFVKMLAVFFVAVALLMVMTPWAILTSLMATVLDGLNHLYTKVVEYLIKTGEGI